MQSLRLVLDGVLKPLLATLILFFLPVTISPARPAPAPAAQVGQDSMARDAGISAVEERRLQHLFWAYNAIWLLLGIYLVSLGVRLRSVKRELARMENRLQQASRGGS